MCLYSVTREKKIEEDLVVYKVVRVTGKIFIRHSSPIYPHEIKVGVNHVKQRWITSASDPKQYQSGFHCMLNKPDADAFLRDGWFGEDKWKVVKYTIPAGTRVTYGKYALLTGSRDCIVTPTIIRHKDS